MIPTIGRIVIYKPAISEKPQSNMAEELPAVIVRVWSEDCVNLKIINDGENDIWKTSVIKGDGEYQWHWPKIQE